MMHLLHLQHQYYLLLLLIPLAALFMYFEFGQKDLDSVKDRKVGDSQYGSARWINKKEKKKLFERIVYDPESWRKGKREGLKQGILFGLEKGFKNKKSIKDKIIPFKFKGKRIVLLDTSDSNSILVGPSGIGKTNFFLLPQIEYAGASGMSFLVTDTKGYVYKTMGNILKKYYGYNVVLIDFRNPTRSEHYNLMQLVNNYMDLTKQNRQSHLGLTYEAKAQKYAKIISKSIIESAGFKGGGDNSYFYDSAEGLITSAILVISEFGQKGERHIISVFKLLQELSRNSSNGEENEDLQTEYAKLLALLPENHKAKWFAGSAIETDIKTALNVFGTALSKLTQFIDSELEQILCFDGDFTAEKFANEKTAVFVVLPEEDKTKYFLFSLFLMQLYRELLNIADEKGGMLDNRVVFFEDEFGTLPQIPDVEMVFSASRSRNILSLPIIQSFGQLKQKYGAEGAEIILDNCQNTIFSGFSPTSKTAEELSKAMGTYTTRVASVSSNNKREKKNLSIQMTSRALMTADEIKRIPKGTFIILKTGVYPIKANIPLYKEWGITFEDDCIASNNIIVKPEYVSIENLKKLILDMELENGKTSIEYIEESIKPKVTSKSRKFHKK